MKNSYSQIEIREAIDTTENIIYTSLNDSLNENIKDEVFNTIIFDSVSTALKNYRTCLEALLDL